MAEITYNPHVEFNYTEHCPDCGGEMLKVPYYMVEWIQQGTPTREAVSLTRDKITYNLQAFNVQPLNGGYCPACTRKAVDKCNEEIRKDNTLAAIKRKSLNDKQMKARYCPTATLVCLLGVLGFLGGIIMLVSGIVGFGLVMMVVFAILAIISGLVSWSDNGGLFPLRNPPETLTEQPLIPYPDFDAEALALNIVERRKSESGMMGLQCYYTPGYMQKLRGQGNEPYV